MAINIKYNSENDTYLVNDKLVYKDLNGNWISTAKGMTNEEKEAFFLFKTAHPITITPNNIQKAIIEELKAERIKQELKFGRQNHTPFEWLPILGEEVGEVNKAALETYFKYDGADNDYSEYRKELIQVAAVALAMVECLDRNNINVNS